MIILTELVDVNFDLYSQNEEINIFAIGDIHLGNKNFDKKLFENTLKNIQNYNNYYLLLMGDLCEYITPKDPRFDVKCVEPEFIDPDNQYAAMRDYLEPFSDRIIGIHLGNHEYSIQKYHYKSITLDLCRN